MSHLEQKQRTRFKSINSLRQSAMATKGARVSQSCYKTLNSSFCRYGLAGLELRVGGRRDLPTEVECKSSVLALNHRGVVRDMVNVYPDSRLVETTCQAGCDPRTYFEAVYRKGVWWALSRAPP